MVIGPLAWLAAHFDAISSSVFTALVAPLAVYYGKKALDEREKPAIGRNKAREIAGVWCGSGTDSADPNFNFDVRIEMRVKQSTVIAAAVLTSSKLQGVDDLSLSGLFYDNQFLELNYASSDNKRRQLGIAMLKLLDCGTEFEGLFAGYSPLRKELVSGSLKLRKT